MSFETVFERWLQKQGGPEEGSDERREERQQADAGRGVANDDDGMEEEMPVIQREAWREEDMEGMPVLQKMVDLPEERKLGSPPPPPLQITLSLSESYSKQRQSKGSKTKSADKVQGKDSSAAGSQGNNQESYALQQDISALTEKTVLSRVQVEGEHTESRLKVMCRQDSQDPSLKEKTVHQCQAKSALSELAQLNHLTSPIVARGSEVDVVRSPECDLPMEPDSTSEFLLGSGRWLRARKGSEVSRGEGSPWGEVSPHSAACVGLRTPSGSNSEVMVRIEESLAECDSTSMFMSSPSAISPASQGEIEERVCPVLADHEDGASPSHFMCRCRSLPPPSDLMHRDHAPVVVSAASQLSVGVTGTISCQSKSKSWTHLVTRMHSLDDDPAPDLEKVAPSLDLMATPEDGLQSDHESPPVLTLPEQEARVKQFSVEHSHVKDISAEMNQQEAPPLIRYGPEPPQASHSDSPPVLSSNDFDSQEKCEESPPVLSVHGQEVGSKPSKSKRHVDLCDFTRDIDWESAVVETVENPPSLTKYDGEGKPGIILKIRTKGKSATPSVQLISKPESVPKPLTVKRKRHTIDNAEVLSRLRKRHKSEEVDKSSTTGNEEVQTLSVGRKGTDMQHKADAGNSQAPLSHTRPKDKKPRRNTVHLGGDLKVATQDFSLKDNTFALSSVELFRLQTLTHELVCILFPRLQPHLIDIAPESRAFISFIDDIIFSLEHSTSEEILRDCEDLNKKFMKLSLKRSESVPVFSPQVVLCSSPGHVVEDFRGKLCSLFQLLLPDLTVSLTQTLSHSSEKLEMFLKKVIVANKAKVARKAQPCL